METTYRPGWAQTLVTGLVGGLAVGLAVFGVLVVIGSNAGQVSYDVRSVDDRVLPDRTISRLRKSRLDRVVVPFDYLWKYQDSEVQLAAIRALPRG